ncbi:MAG: universal stress protein [Desulfuromonas sp.]|nr:universal stress protein [Desulfuromonas sp.]
MNIMVAYDNSTNAKQALDKTLQMFAALKPKITLVGVVENVLGSSGVNEERYLEFKYDFSEGLRETAQTLNELGISAEVLIAEGDPRKMILQAVKNKQPDLLVIARHSEKLDSNIIGKTLDAWVDEFNFMTFGDVSSFLTRRAPCPVLIQSCQ